MRYITFGESHGDCVGIVVEGFPAGWDASDAVMQAELLRRQGGTALTTPRREEDEPRILSGVYRGKTTGEPLCIVIENHHANDADYAALQDVPRPGHADYAVYIKSDGHNDPRGGGHHSGRLTAPLVAAGAIAKQGLSRRGIRISAELREVGGVPAEEAEAAIRAAQAEQDSLGGTVVCTVCGLPAGLGGSEYDQTVEGAIARHVFAIPAVKAIGFGDGEALGRMHGSEANDAFAVENGAIRPRTNHAGGINGGITNGADVTFTVTFRPTPSIGKAQPSVNIKTKEPVELTITGRHDPCVALRAVPAVEAAAALAILEIEQQEEQQ